MTASPYHSDPSLDLVDRLDLSHEVMVIMEMSIRVLYEKTLVFLDKEFCMYTLGLILIVITRLYRDIKRYYSIL